MSTRVLFACWPFEGHLYPQMSMAHALRARGAEVAFYTAESARELIEGEGFELHPFKRVGPAWRRVHEGARGTGGRREAVRLMRASRDWIVGTIPDQVADVEEIVSAWRADVVGCEASMFGPLVVLSDLQTVPVALVSPLITSQLPGPEAPAPGGLAPAATRRAQLLGAGAERLKLLLTRPMRRRIDAVRRERGLGPLGGAVTASWARLPLFLVQSVPELDYRRGDLPPCVQYVGPCLWHPREPTGTLEWLDALPRDRPWVHVTEGTSHFQEPVLLRAAARGLAGAGCEAILTTGRDRDPEALGLTPTAANVHVAPWLSHGVLMERCAALVCTGGMGTVIAALRAGVPLVVVPTNWDKPAIARLVVDAGVGIRLAPRRCTPERVRAAVARVLADRRYRDNAARLAQRLAAAPGAAGAAEQIERLASSARERSSRTTLMEATGR